MVVMKVFGLALDEDSQAPVLILKDEDETRVLPIWIGAMEAMAISLALNDVQLPRPMTHDLLLKTITALDCRVLGVDVIDIRDGTYYAELEVDHGGSHKRIDCRPSDAIALALRAEVPISVSEEVLDKAAQDKKTSTIVTAESDEEQWKDLLESLDPDDTKYKM